MTDRLSYDAPRMTPDKATEIYVYHLRCTAGLFQLVSDDENEALRAEIIRQNKDDLEETDIQPAMLWAAAMYAAYEKMKSADQ